ncbi:diphthine--ammonia ligase isoform X2 [Petaurus breviceps papuanus]|uniref:diphthine--ammonia ligase isoform X2 n=1 Tax=Petaurus breviceps papuanus TaxID=3040969 RepID=UPI0036DBC225
MRRQRYSVGPNREVGRQGPLPLRRKQRGRRREFPIFPCPHVSDAHAGDSDMRVAALISGGKDSCYNMMQCVAAGHQIVALANLRPAKNQVGSDELDSYMYQTVGHQAIELFAEAMGLPLYRQTIKGTSVETGRMYTRCEGDEVEDLYELLKCVKEKEEIDGVSVGAILSDYQRVRVENVCRRLDLQPLAYLWRRNQEDLFREMISSGVQAMIIKVAAFGLDPDKHLGKTLDQVESDLCELSKKYGVNVCGEGGEYETFTLDCPLFKKKVVVDSSEVVLHSADAFAPVAYLRFLELHLEEKLTSPDKLFAINCSCEMECNEDRIPAITEENRQDEIPPIWKSSHSPLLQYYKKSECSRKSPNGYQWINCITASFVPSEQESVVDAAAEAFSSLQDIINAEGLELKDIILVYMYVRNMEDFSAINSAYVKMFNLYPPTRVCVEALLPDKLLFSLDCLAHKSNIMIGEVFPYSKEVMHIQSISHWAPANIGPYSQAIKVGDVLCVAGQIALVPCTMKLVGGGVWTEASVSLRHTLKILKAMSQETTLHHVLLAHCYVTSSKYIPAALSTWQKNLKTQKKEDHHETYGITSETNGILVIVVVPRLPRDSAIEWHVITVVDEPLQRKHFILEKKSESCLIECETVESISASCACISISLRWVSSFGSLPDLNQALQDLVAMFLQAMARLSGDKGMMPLCFRTFYKKDSIDITALHTGLQALLEEQIDAVPALVLVPVTDLPKREVIHVACWLSA